MSSVRNFYLAVPLMLGLSACAPAQTFVFVNSPKDLEYKLKDHRIEMADNVNRGINRANAHYFDMKMHNPSSDDTTYRRGMMRDDMMQRGMYGMNRNRDMRGGMRGQNGREMNMPREDMMRYKNLMNDYKDMPEAIGEIMPMTKINKMRDMDMRGMQPMDRMHDMNRVPGRMPMYGRHVSDSSMFRPYMKNDTSMYHMRGNMMRNNMMRGNMQNMMHKK